MKIKITTHREIKDIDFDLYINSLEKEGISINRKQLLDKGEFSFTNNDGITKVSTTYKIVK